VASDDLGWALENGVLVVPGRKMEAETMPEDARMVAMRRKRGEEGRIMVEVVVGLVVDAVGVSIAASLMSVLLIAVVVMAVVVVVGRW